MNRYILACIFGLVGLLSAIGQSLGHGNSITINAILTGAGLGIFAAVSKLMDPESVVTFDPRLTAFLLACGTALPLLKDAMADGHVTGAEGSAILVAFMNQFWAKFSQPGKVLGFRR